MSHGANILLVCWNHWHIIHIIAVMGTYVIEDACERLFAKGHSALTFDHCLRQIKQNECAQLLGKDLLLKDPKQIKQFSGKSRRDGLASADFSLLSSEV